MPRPFGLFRKGLRCSVQHEGIEGQKQRNRRFRFWCCEYRHSGVGRNPGNLKNWTPAFAGVTCCFLFIDLPFPLGAAETRSLHWGKLAVV